MARIIYESNIPDVIEFLAKEARVYVPAVADHKSHTGGQIFTEYKKGQALDFSYTVTVLPPKEFLLPPQEILFNYKNNKISSPRNYKKVLFGISYEDLEGVNKLGEIFERPIKDDAYENNNKENIIVAIDKYSPPKNLKFDLYLMRIEEGVYAAYAGSKIGQKIIKTKHFRNQKINVANTIKKPDSPLSDPELSSAIEKSKSHPVWNELAEICFGCGICSYVCPLCYCFEVEDKIEFSEENRGSRCREWDSCMLKSFANTTHHNFRQELRDRIYNWYFHKFVRMPKEYGFSGCVDCHRCTVYCPAEISYRKTLQIVLDDYKKKVKK